VILANFCMLHIVYIIVYSLREIIAVFFIMKYEKEEDESIDEEQWEDIA